MEYDQNNRLTKYNGQADDIRFFMVGCIASVSRAVLYCWKADFRLITILSKRF